MNKHPHTNLNTVFWLVVTGYLLVAFGLGLFVPVQSDEVAWFFLNHRSVMDGFQRMMLFPQCGKEHFLHALPYALYLPALIDHATYGQMTSPLHIRLAGLVQYTVWLCLLGLLLRKLFQPTQEQGRMLMVAALGFMALDTLPLLMVMNRPEQPMAMLTTALLVLYLHREALASSLTRKIAATLLLFLLVMMLHALHPKVAAFAPFEAAIAYGVMRTLWRWRSAGCLGIALVIAIAANAYLGETQSTCPGSPEIQAFLDRCQTSFALLKNPPEFFAKALLSFMNAVGSDVFINRHLATNAHMWLPLSPQGAVPVLDGLTGVYDQLVYFAKLCLLLHLHVRCFTAVAVLIGRRRSQPGTDKMLIAVFLGLMLAMDGMFVFMGPQRQFYANIITMPLLLLLLLLDAKLFRREVLFYKRYVWLGIGICAALNLSLLLYRYAPLVYAPERAEIVRPDNLQIFSPFGYGDKAAVMRELAGECGIADDPSLKHLVLDDITYFQFRRSSQPFHLYYLTGDMGDMDKLTPETLFKPLKDYGSDGLVTDCRALPRNIRPLATEKDGICCIPKKAWLP
jgi:hypothetical protein